MNLPRFCLLFPIFPLFPDFPPPFPDFQHFFSRGGGGTLPHLDPPGAQCLFASFVVYMCIIFRTPLKEHTYRLKGVFSSGFGFFFFFFFFFFLGFGLFTSDIRIPHNISGLEKNPWNKISLLVVPSSYLAISLVQAQAYMNKKTKQNKTKQKTNKQKTNKTKSVGRSGLFFSDGKNDHIGPKTKNSKKKKKKKKKKSDILCRVFLLLKIL